MSDKLTDEGREKIKNQLRKKAVKVVREAKKNAPVDTGRLRSSITFNIKDTGELPEAVIGSNVEYAKEREFGTVNSPPTPYLRPALKKLRAGQL